jgi:hypothetical protein
MTAEHDLDTQLRQFFGDAELDVAPRPGMAGQVLAGARRRAQARTVTVAATAVAALSAAGAAVAATGGGDDDRSVVPETQDPGYCPEYGYWEDEEAGVGRLYTMHPTPADESWRRTDIPTGPPPTSVEPSYAPTPGPSDTRTPLPTDKPTPSPPPGCVVPGPGAWNYGPPSPAPWGEAAEQTGRP